MRIIGVDPGLVNTGVGVIEKLSASHPGGDGVRFLYSQVIRPHEKALSQRLLYIHEELMKIVTETRADIMAVEDQFFGKNVQTAFKTGQARGAALLAAARSEIPSVLLAPTRIKQAVVGYGQASKEQVRHMVGQILSLKDIPESLDCSDALAVALCHAFSPKLAPVDK